MKLYYMLFLIFFSMLIFSSCAKQQVPLNTYSKNIVFKSKKLKFYDLSFITIYKDFIKLEVFNSANLVLTLRVFKDKICKDNFSCISAKKFNKKHFSSNYNDSFLYDILSKQNASFEDKQRSIMIKVF